MKPLPPRRPAAALRLEPLEDRTNPSFLTGAEIVVGADAGSPPLVRLIDPTTQEERSQFLAFDGGFFGGVRVAVADVTGDQYPDLIVAAGPSGGPVVKVYDGKSGDVVSSFFAFSPSFTGGVFIAAADVDGDGTAEIIAGAGAGGGPQVSLFDGLTGQPLGSWFAYDEEFRNGVRVAAGDTNGDGLAEVVTAAGYGGGPHVMVFRPNVGNLSAPPATAGSFFAYAPSFTGGMTIAVGDIDGDGRGEVITGAGFGGGPQVNVFNETGRHLNAFFAYEESFLGGVRVGAADLTGDGTAEIITSPGPTGAAHVKVFSLPATNPIGGLFAFPTNQITGTYVDGSPTPLAIPPTPAFIISDSYDQLRRFQESQRPIVTPPQQPGVPPTVVVVQQQPIFPFWGLGFGFGLPWWIGPAFYDAPGLFVDVSSVYAPSFFGTPGYFGAPEFVPAPFFYQDFGVPIDPSYFDPFGYPIDMNYLSLLPPEPVYIDPGFYDTGFYGIGDYYDPGFYDFGYYDPGFYDYGYYDYGYYDYGYFDNSFYYGGFDYGWGGFGWW